MKAAVFKKVVEYLYTGKVKKLSFDLSIETLAASNLLGLKGLQHICERAIQPLLSPENVIGVYEAAVFHNATQLANGNQFPLCRSMYLLVGILLMVQWYSEVCKEKEFDSLPKEVQETIKTKFEKLDEQKKMLRAKQVMSCFLYSQRK